MRSTKSFMASPNKRKAMSPRLQHILCACERRADSIRYSSQSLHLPTCEGEIVFSKVLQKRLDSEPVANYGPPGDIPAAAANEPAVIAGMEKIRMRLGQK